MWGNSIVSTIRAGTIMMKVGAIIPQSLRVTDKARREICLARLGSHTILAVVIVPLILIDDAIPGLARTVRAHKKIAR